MSTATAEKCLLRGGPFHLMDGEVVGKPLTLVFGESGGFVYRLDPDTLPDEPTTYVYAPELSPAHEAVVDADRQAILEVAAEKGITPEQLMREVQQGKHDRGGRRPAEVLIAEAARLGCSPLDLLQQGYDPVTGLYLPEERA